MSNKLKVEFNQRLFDEWTRLGEQVKSCRGIVQNSTNITQEQFEEFQAIVSKLKMEIIELEGDTVNHIIDCNNPF